MPGFCTPWPGNSSAMGPLRLIKSGPLQERRAPCQAGPESGQQDVVAAVHAAGPYRLLESDRNRSARRVAELVDVDGDAVKGQTDPARGRVDDAEVRLVRHPEVELVRRDARGGGDLLGLADEDVDRELEDVGALHVDDRAGVLRRVGAERDVAARDLLVPAPIAAEAPREEAGPLRRRRDDGRARTVTEDHRGAAVRVVEHARQDLAAADPPLVHALS